MSLVPTIFYFVEQRDDSSGRLIHTYILDPESLWEGAESLEGRQIPSHLIVTPFVRDEQRLRLEGWITQYGTLNIRKTNDRCRPIYSLTKPS